MSFSNMFEILKEIEFKFIIKSRDISICMFEIETKKDKSRIKIKAYNEQVSFTNKTPT